MEELVNLSGSCRSLVNLSTCDYPFLGHLELISKVLLTESFGFETLNSYVPIFHRETSLWVLLIKLIESWTTKR